MSFCSWGIAFPWIHLCLSITSLTNPNPTLTRFFEKGHWLYPSLLLMSKAPCQHHGGCWETFVFCRVCPLPVSWPWPQLWCISFFCTAQMNLISIEELLSHLLVHEARLQHHATATSLFSTPKPTANFFGRNRGYYSLHNGNCNHGRGHGPSGHSSNHFPISSQSSLSSDVSVKCAIE